MSDIVKKFIEYQQAKARGDKELAQKIAVEIVEYLEKKGWYGEKVT